MMVKADMMESPPVAPSPSSGGARAATRRSDAYTLLYHEQVAKDTV